MSQLRKCVVCGGSDHKDWIKKSNHQIVKCITCGFAFIHPMPKNMEISELYSYDYFEKGKYKDYGYDGYLKKKERHIANARKRLGYLLHHRQKGRLLDVGTGLGFFVKMASEHFKAEGLEISEYGVKYANEELRVMVQKGSLDTVAYRKESFDIVTGYGILEHVPDPVLFIKMIYKILKPKGLTVLCAPNISCWNRYLQGKKWCGFRAPEHLYYFKPEHLKHLLREAGFLIKKARFVEENKLSDVMNIYGERV